MSKKKVLVWETLSTISGGQKMTLTVMDLLKSEYEFLCLIPGKGLLSDELEKRGIPYVCMGDQTLPTGVKGKSVIFRYGWMSVRSILKSLTQIKKYDPDLLYAPGPAALPWSAVCGMLTRKPVIWHLHHIFLDGATKKLLNICSRWKMVKTIIAVSRCVGEQITNPSAVGKIEVLYNPVDVEKYASGNPEKVLEELRNAVDFDRDRHFVIGHVALIQRSKRQDFVLDVIAKLKSQGWNVLGLFAGECREQDYEEELRNKVSSLGLENNALFLGRRSDIPDLLKVMDVLVIPSSFEGFPLAGLEAAAAGVPVAACDVAGAREYVEQSNAGQCFKENDIDAAAQCVAQLLQTKQELAQFGKEFAEKCSEKHYKVALGRIFKR